MANCLKTIGEWNITLFPFFFIGKPYEYFLIFTIFIVQLDLFLLNGRLPSLFLWDIIHLKGLINKDDLFLRVFGKDSLETM
jgi:hypothetical protein